MDIQDIDKLVVATLAAARAAATNKETPGQYIAEYEKMLRVFERRKAKALEPSDGPDSSMDDDALPVRATIAAASESPDRPKQRRSK